MALREFRDSEGRLWQVWNVTPTFKPVRSGEDRRRDTIEIRPNDRRRTPERRGAGPRPPWIDGWLTFQCGPEVRRLMPIPQSWEECSPECLEEYIERAQASAKKRDA